MKCTECSKEIKPVVAIDIDGTMGMYHQHFLQFAADYLGKRQMTHYVGNQDFKSWFCENYRVSTEVWHDIKLAYRQGSMKRTMPCYNGAQALCVNIKLAGAELWVTTTRPYIRHDNIDPDTREWLRRWNIPYDYLLYDGNKYQKLAMLVGSERVCAVLDDLDDELNHVEVLFGSEAAILRLNNFNKAYSRPDRIEARNLDSAWHIIRDRIRRWRIQYDPESLRRDGGPDSARTGDEVQGEVR